MPVRIPDTTVRGPSTGTNTEAQREIARRTAQKIDQIESEMIEVASPLARPAKPIQVDAVDRTPHPADVSAAGRMSVVAPGAKPPVPSPSVALPSVAAPAQRPVLPALDPDTAIVLGDAHAAAGVGAVAAALLPRGAFEHQHLCAVLLRRQGRAQRGIAGPHHDDIVG